jgi:hypothetical protein
MGGQQPPYGLVSPNSSIDDELFPEDYEQFGTPVNVNRAADPSRTHPWVDPSILKLMHRVGRGHFGDVWLATIHNRTEDFDEYHEVAVKMLPTGSEEQVHSLLQKFESLFHTVQGLRGVSWPYGVSIKDGKVQVSTCGPLFLLILLTSLFSSRLRLPRPQILQIPF